MKFHNQKSFMGHEISNVKNKPLLHKKGKQWIVVAISALVLAGFGGMVSATTHADATAQPATTKVAPKPANTSATVMKQAKGMHKVLTNNAAMQKTNAPSSAVTQKIAPVSATSTTSAKSSSVSASSSASSKVSSSVNSANAKSSFASSSSSNSNNKATKPAVHMMLMSTPAPTVPEDKLAPQGVSQTATGKWSNDAKSATWNLYSNGQLDLHDGKVVGGWPNNSLESKVKYFNTSNITNSDNLPFGNASAWNMFSSDQAIKDINLSGLPQNWKVSGNWGHGFCDIPHVSDINLGQPNTSGNHYFDTMFANDTSLKSIEGLQYFNTNNTTNMSNMFYNCPQLKSLDLSSFNSTHVNNSQPDYINGGTHSGNYNMFQGDTNLSSIKLGPNDKFEPDSGISPYAFAPNANISTTTPKQLDDNQNNEGTWSIYQHGKWNSSEWYLNNGTLLITDGTLSTNNNTNNLLAGTGMSLDQAKSVNNIEFTSDVIAPNSSSNSRLFDDEGGHAFDNLRTINVSGLKTSDVHNFLAMFCGLKGLQHIYHLSDLDMSNASDEQWMFGYDSDLQDLDLSQIKAPKFSNAGNIFVNDKNLHQLTLGSNENLSSITYPPFSDWQNDNTGDTANINSLGQGTWIPIIKNNIHFNGASLSGDKIVSGVDGTSSNISAPNNYHYINGNHGNFTYNINNSDHLFDVAPNSINIKFHHNGLPIYSDNNVDTTGCITDNYKLQNLPNVPQLADYKLADPSESTIQFTDSNRNYVVDVISNKPAITSEAVEYTSGANNKILATATISGSTNSTVYGLKNTTDSNLQNMPTGYQLASSSDYNTKPISYNSSNFSIAVTPIQKKDTINYQYNGNSEGSYQFSGNDVAASGASGTNFTLSSGNASGLSNNYQLVDASQSFDYDGGTYNVAVEPKSATDTINYMNGSNEVGSAEFSGAYNSSFSIGSAPSNLNSNYYSIKNPSQSFAYNNGTYDVSVSPKRVSESIIFSGDPKANSTVSGVYGTSSSVSAPSGYEFSNGVNGNFSFDGSNHTFNVIPTSATDTISFSSNNNTVSSTSMTGSYNDKGSVSAPNGYHFTNDQSSETFTYNNTSVPFSVAPNSATEKINYVYQNGNGTFNEGSTNISGAYNEQGAVTSSNDKGLSSGYQLSSANNRFTYANGSASDNVKVVPESASAIVDYQYNNSTVSSYTSSGNNYQATDAGDTSFNANKNVPKYYHVVSDNEINYDNQIHHVNVYPNTVTVNYMYGNNDLSDDTATFDGKSKDTTIPDDFGIPAGYQLANNKTSLPFNNQTVKVFITPATKSDTINYMYNNTKVGSAKVSGEDVYAGGSAFNANDNMPAGYHALDSNNGFYYDGQRHDVNVAPNTNTDTINYMFNDTKVGSTKVSGKDMYAGGSTFNANNNVPFGYHAIDSNNGFYYDNQQHDVAVKPNTITVNYMNGKNKISSDTATFDGNNKDNSITTDYDLPAGYQLAQANNQLKFNKSANVDVSVKPISKTDTINYMFNGTKVGYAQVSGEDMYANDSTFNANDHVTAGYHAVDTNNFHYDGQTHDVVVKPNTITVNYKYNNGVVGYDTIAYKPNSKVNADYDIPAGYQLTQANNQLQFNKPANVVDVPVKPVNKTDVINYMNNGTKVSSTKVSGVDVYANDSIFDANKNVPAGYYAVDANNNFYYDGQTHNVAVKPDIITLNYMNGTKRISSDTATFDGNSTISADYDLPAGYQLAQNNNQLKFNQPFNAVNVSVKPTTKTDTINYMYNDTKVGSTKANGEDMYANASTFNANNDVPAGYHAVDSNNGFYYDGQVHDVSVVPNVDTDTVNYQANGKTLASQQFKGNDEHATEAGDNSFDVTAKNATKMPNGYELVNNNNEFSFDNGSHDVAVQAIPQPSVPFVPSMPASSANSSSASSSASAPASMAAPTSEKPTQSEPATHYQYTKVVTPLQLHTSKHFTKKNGVFTVKHPTEFKIMKIVHDHKHTRYEVKYQGHNYFITANIHFTINNYVQKHDFNSHKHMIVKVIKPMIEYKHIHYNKKNAIRNIHKGTILSVKRVFTIGKGEKTRFELTNGKFVTSNKLFVKVIK